MTSNNDAGRSLVGRWSLRAQMAGAVLACLALFVVAAGVLTARSYGEDREEARQQLGQLARTAAEDLGSTVTQTETVLAGIAAQEAVAALDPGRCQPVLQGFSGIGDAHLVLVGASDTTLCSSLPNHPPGGAEYAGVPWLAQVRTTGNLSHAEPVVDPVTGRASFVVAVATPPGAPPSGAVLAAVLGLDALVPHLVGPLEEARGTVLLVLDPERRTLLASVPGGRAGTPLGDVPFARRATSAEFEVSYPDTTRRVYHQAAVPGLGWHVYAGLPASVAFAPAREAVRQAAILGAVVLAVLALLSMVLHRQVVRPARALNSAILSARGATPGPAPVHGPAELARIAVEFNNLQEERSRDEEALRTAEERFRGAFDGAAVGSALLGFPRRIVRVNRALCELLGATEEDLLDQDLDAIVHPEDRERADELSHRLRGGEAGPMRAEMRLLRRDGATRVAEITTSVIRDASGEPVYIHAQYLDVTERRRAEEAVRALNAELGVRVAELDEARAELQRALVRFTQMQEEQRRLVAQAIHDHTVQALTATVWSLDDLMEREDDPSRRAVLDQARANLREAVTHARSLLFGLRPPLLDELGLTAAVEQQLARLSTDADLEVRLESDLERRFPAHLETLAFRTTEEALRNVRLHARASAVTVRIAAGDSEVQVTVDDDGVGLQPGDVAYPPDGQLGLVSMRETITMAGGRFSVGPRPAGGTRLWFTLPLEPAGRSTSSPV